MTVQLAGLDPQVRAAAERALSWAKYYQIPVTVTSGYRSWAEQTRLRKQYEDCLAAGEKVYPGNPNPACRYPANEPGDSAHNYRWAWDSWVPPEYQWAWTYLRQMAGFTVPQNDPIHAEVPNWRQYLPAPLKRG
jgi:hypothetical protein